MTSSPPPAFVPDPASAVRAYPTGRQCALVLALALLILGGTWAYVRVTDRAAERSRALAAIEAGGGKYYSPMRGRPWIYRLVATVVSGGNDPDQFDVLLKGPAFDDAWLERHHDLRSMPLLELYLLNTNLSRDAVLRLFNQNRLSSFSVSGIPLTDADATLFGRQERLTRVNLVQSEITDAGFAALRPQRLLSINVAGTHVTPAALLSGLTGPKLHYVGVDGRQFTPELATHLAQMRSVNQIALLGPEITDAHMKLLESMPNLYSIFIDQTSATDEAVAALKAANPKAVIDVFDAKSTLFGWRHDTRLDEVPATDDKGSKPH